MTTISIPELKYIQANGLKFAYFEEGSGPLVLLVHGFPDTAHTWDQVRPALAAAGFRAVSPFTRGYAPTEIPREEAFDADTLGRDILALIEALGETQAILVGHDWGASAAFSAVGLMPSRIRKLITLALPHPLSLTFMPFFFWPFVMWGCRHYFWLSRKNAADRIKAKNMVYLDTLVQRWSPGWNVPLGETDEVKKSFETPGSLEAALGYYRAVNGPGLPTTAQRIKVSVPSIAFCGTSGIPPAAFEGARKCYLNRYEVVSMPGGHSVHREHPSHFMQELLRVLAEDSVS
ncbi:MAG TPA: alpha/beta hydrolase [Aestuariivirga sp.]